MMADGAQSADASLAVAPAGGASGPGNGWAIGDISPDGKLTQRVEGQTRKTWAFNDFSKDRVQVALTSEGRPVTADIQLWIGPDWTPFSMKAYSEDGKLRPIQTLIGTRNKAAMIEGAMVNKPATIPAEATTSSERVDGGALRSYPIDASVKQLEVVLKTDGKQLNARIELLNAPNNPKQTFECFTNNGELNSLCVCFNIPDEYTTSANDASPPDLGCSRVTAARFAGPLVRSGAARTMERFMDEGTHVLVSSAKNMGEAAAVLPVISTLSFGFAAGELLGQDASSHAAVLLLLALSASFSLFATTYSVLESYYISMLTASDTRSHYAYGVCDRERASSTSQRDELARVIVDFLQGFEPWRQRARDALWLS
ncbi:hypothetical protein JL721_9379 [Aureococcus anophagefferens]|nr:hypothetical protein JL721_9379 [Aureococcus anophagefferens]